MSVNILVMVYIQYVEVTHPGINDTEDVAVGIYAEGADIQHVE